MFTATLAFLGIACLYFLAQPYIWLLGALLPLSIIGIDLQDDDKEPGFIPKMLFRLAIVGTFPAIALVTNWLVSGQITTKYYFAGTWIFGKYIAAMAISTVAVFLILRSGSQWADIAKSKLTKTTNLERNKKTDIRDMAKFLPKALDFDPLKYINLKKGVFLGLNEHQEAVYIEFPGGTSAPHVQVIGTTGAGKGVSLGVMASQFLERGEAVFFCDPKNDEWAPHVLYAAAKRLGVPFHFVNLNSPVGPQLNPFAGATKDEVFELFVGGFGLTEKGIGADFFSIDDRYVASGAAVALARGCTAASLYEEQGEQMMKDAKKFAGKLRELASTPSINASSGGVDLAAIVNGGGVVYIVGSMRNDIIKTIQRMLLIRFIQLAERRDRLAGPLRPVCIVLDEVKYHISRPALEGLGAARDKGVHLVLAHQSLGDLRDSPKDIDPDAVVDAIVENCRIKICYQVQNPKTAEWLAEMSGEMLADDESRTVTKNLALSETIEGRRNIRQTARYYIDTNMLLSLPKSVCVLYGSGLPQFVTIKPILAPKSSDAIAPAIVAGAAAATPTEALSLDDDDFPDPMAQPDYSEEPEAPEPAAQAPEPAPRNSQRPATATPSPARCNPLDLDDL